jgi:signal transduction histidine kinase
MRAMDSLSEIAQLRDRISELEREKAEVEGFAAVAAHELLTPVVMIDACAATVSDRLADACHEESRRDLAMLRRGCTQSRLLVECLLHQAAFRDRLLQTRRVELDALVRDCVALLGPEIRARGAQVQVSPLPAVDAEAPLISAVLMNLLVNALKYGPRRSPTVRVDATWESAAWRFSVESEGQTIPVEDRELIFEPRRRGRAERRAHGGGLGLAICRQIVTRHGGEISVAAGAHGRGNCFSFTLPA